MFGRMFTADEKVSTVRTRSARLSLEHLESRDTPSTLTLSVTYGLGHNVTLSGDLTNTSTPANQSIMLSGQVALMTTTDTNGHFSVATSATALGEIDAQTMDGQSNVASVTLTDTAPQAWALSCIECTGDVWEFKGTVTWNRPFTTMSAILYGPYPSVGDFPVVVQSNGTVTNGVSTGTYDVFIQLNGQTSDNGSVIFQATDCWGLLSNEAQGYIYQSY